jgi:hypothetical protein
MSNYGDLPASLFRKQKKKKKIILNCSTNQSLLKSSLYETAICLPVLRIYSFATKDLPQLTLKEGDKALTSPQKTRDGKSVSLSQYKGKWYSISIPKILQGDVLQKLAICMIIMIHLLRQDTLF